MLDSLAASRWGIVLLLIIISIWHSSVEHDILKHCLTFKCTFIPFLVDAFTNHIWNIVNAKSILLKYAFSIEFILNDETVLTYVTKQVNHNFFRTVSSFFFLSIIVILDLDQASIQSQKVISAPLLSLLIQWFLLILSLRWRSRDFITDCCL